MALRYARAPIIAFYPSFYSNPDTKNEKKYLLLSVTLQGHFCSLLINVLSLITCAKSLLIDPVVSKTKTSDAALHRLHTNAKKRMVLTIKKHISEHLDLKFKIRIYNAKKLKILKLPFFMVRSSIRNIV